MRAHAVQLFGELKDLHELPADYESWLAAAAILRDTGKFINHQGHHRHTQYIISSSEIYGYTQVQRTVVSAIARYLGKSRPQPGDRALAQHSRRGAQERAARGGAAAAGRCAEPGSRQRRAARCGQGVSEAGLP